MQIADGGSYAVTVSNSLGAVTSNIANLTVVSIITPPAITADPQKLSTSVGTSATFAVGATGSVPLSYQWYVNGAPIAGATQATLTLPHTSSSPTPATHSVIVSNPFGTKNSIVVPLSVSSTAIPPIFQFQPSDTTVSAGGSASLSVGVVGSAPISYQWSKNGTAIVGANQTYLNVPQRPRSLLDSGVYSVTITNPAGTVTSTNATLTVTPAGSPPVGVKFAQQPQPLSNAVGSTAVFSVGVTGDPTITYQWRKNQIAIAGAVQPTFTINNVQASDAGTYDVLVANGFSADISFPTLLIVTPPAGPSIPSRLINLSTRVFDGTGDQALAIGFVVQGSGTKPALVRAVGPTLTSLGVTGVLADPQLTLFTANSQPMASNDNWGGTAAMTTSFQQVGAFAALPANSLDAAITASLARRLLHRAGRRRDHGSSGIALLEVYDSDPSATPTSRLVNLSARGMVGSGNNVLIVGFVINGNTSEKLLIRAIGPSLPSFPASRSVSV